MKRFLLTTFKRQNRQNVFYAKMAEGRPRPQNRLIRSLTKSAIMSFSAHETTNKHMITTYNMP